jgi:predicted ester cyclase
MTEDCLFSGNAPGLQGIVNFVQFTSILRNALAIYFTLDVIITAEDDERVSSLSTMQGTHAGGIWGIPASGKQFAVPRIDTFLFVEGKIYEVQTTFDKSLLMDQLRSRE